MTVLLTETAYAKINLALHVRTKREDGYHELETLFAFVNSKRGRWFGDCLFGGYGDGCATEQVRLWTEE